jgi:hypothetical protein
MTDFPAEPLSALAEAASGLHELFLSYVAAGFTDIQALHLVGLLLTASLAKPGADS